MMMMMMRFYTLYACMHATCMPPQQPRLLDDDFVVFCLFVVFVVFRRRIGGCMPDADSSSTSTCCTHDVHRLRSNQSINQSLYRRGPGPPIHQTSIFNFRTHNELRNTIAIPSIIKVL